MCDAASLAGRTAVFCPGSDAVGQSRSAISRLSSVQPAGHGYLRGCLTCQLSRSASHLLGDMRSAARRTWLSLSLSLCLLHLVPVVSPYCSLHVLLLLFSWDGGAA